MPRLPAPIAALAAAAALGGCGGAPGASDPANVIPRSAYFYAEAVVDPDGGQEAAMRSILARLPGTGPPEQRLERLIAEPLRESDEGGLDYASDVKPWLGEKIAFFTSAPAEGARPGTMPMALVLAADDEDAARDAIRKSGGSDLTERSYKDVEYWRDRDDDGDLNAGGVIDGFAVIGTEAGFRAAVDAAAGEALGDGDRFADAVADVEDERIGLMYADIQGMLTALGRQTPDAALPLAAVAGPFRRLFGDKPIVATARAEDDGIVVDSALSADAGLGTLFGQPTGLLDELPARAWLAYGQPELGKYLRSLVDAFAGAVGGRDQLAALVRRQTGLDLDRDILGWIGDLALFVRGTGPDDIGGGAVVETTDRAASERALAGIQALIRRSGEAAVGPAGVPGADAGFSLRDEDVPQPIHFVQRGDRVVIAYGRAAAIAALGDGPRLETDPAYREARAKLGEGFDPSMFVAVGPILDVARNFGADRAHLAKAERWLRLFDHVASGNRREGDEIRSRTRITLEQR